MLTVDATTHCWRVLHCQLEATHEPEKHKGEITCGGINTPNVILHLFASLSWVKTFCCGNKNRKTVEEMGR